MQREVTSRIVLNVLEPAELVLSVAVARQYSPAEESLVVTLDGDPLEVQEWEDAHGTRLHRVTPGTGELVVEYEARIDGAADRLPGDPVERVVYSRPSRYAESDALAPTAAAEFDGLDGNATLLTAVSSWVGTRLAYVPGSSLPTDGAQRTLLARKGVCRDFAHLSVALLRATGVPARLVSVYAPGLDPMDFHAVAEAWIGGAWCVVDATTLAPRETLVRIATGRDAADTAFLTILSGRTELVDMTVTAVADDLPADDLDRLVSVS